MDVSVRGQIRVKARNMSVSVRVSRPREETDILSLFHPNAPQPNFADPSARERREVLSASSRMSFACLESLRRRDIVEYLL